MRRMHASGNPLERGRQLREQHRGLLEQVPAHQDERLPEQLQEKAVRDALVGWRAHLVERPPELLQDKAMQDVAMGR